jgi:hypothetical protein
VSGRASTDDGGPDLGERERILMNGTDMSARPLIPRRKLFDDPTFFGAKLSPDGRLISWLAPADGVLNVWVSPADDIAAGLPVTRTKGRPINWQEYYLLDLSTGQRSLLWENRQEFGFVGLDWQLRPRHACSYGSDDGLRLWRLDGEKATLWRDVSFESMATSLMLFDAAGKHLHMLFCIEHDELALVRVDWSSGEEHTLFGSERADVTGLILNGLTFEPEAVSIDPGRQEWEALTPAVAPELAPIKARLRGHAFHVQSQTDDNRRGIVVSHTAEQPATWA